MDFNSLKEQVSNLTLYDIKAGVRKVQNGRYSNEASTSNPSFSPDFRQL
jgi:epsin